VETAYRLDVCHVTKGGHPKHLKRYREKTMESFSFRLQVTCYIHFFHSLYPFYEIYHEIMNNFVLRDMYIQCSLDINNQEVFYQVNDKWGDVLLNTPVLQKCQFFMPPLFG
jgi:hypothetical protein